MSLLDGIAKIFHAGHMHKYMPSSIAVTTDSQALIKDLHTRNAFRFYVVLTDVSGLGASDYVLIGQQGEEHFPLFGFGDTYPVEADNGFTCDIGDLYVKTTGGTAEVVVIGSYHEAIY